MLQYVNRTESLSNIPMLAKNSSDNNISAEEVSRKISKAKTMLYQESMANNPKAMNLLFMAEKALKNGNPAAADNFTERAMQIIKPETTDESSPNIPSLKIPQTTGSTENTEHSYHDVSGDTGVSFSYPSKLTGPQSFIAVPAHEAQHVSRRISEALLSGDRVNISVSYKIRYDPRTGEAYMAGGTTRTVRFSSKKADIKLPGQMVDVYV